MNSYAITYSAGNAMTARFSDPIISKEAAFLLYYTAFWPALMWAVCWQLPQRTAQILEFKPRGM